MIRVRRLVKWLAVAAGMLALLVALGVAYVIVSEWTYIQRLRTHPKDEITNVAWYTPLEPVPGGDGAPLPRAGEEAKGLDEAARLAEKRNASALLVVHEGQVVFERHWRGHTPDSWTNSASMAKTITALLIGIAVDEGLIPSLDAPAADYLPAWKGDARSRITIRHLLQMHSGLQPDGEYTDPFSDAAYLTLGTDMRFVVDHIPAVEAPGVRFDYNNVNFQALGFILEAATHRRYAAYLSEKLWKPLGAREAAVWLDREGGSAHAAGHLFASAEDWAKVGLLFLNDGLVGDRRVVSAGHLRAMRAPSPDSPVYGLGLWLADDAWQAKEDEPPYLSQGITYLDGRHKQRVYIIPEHALVVVRVGEDGRPWEESALPNAVVSGLFPR